MEDNFIFVNTAIEILTSKRKIINKIADITYKIVVGNKSRKKRKKGFRKSTTTTPAIPNKMLFKRQTLPLMLKER